MNERFLGALPFEKNMGAFLASTYSYSTTYNSKNEAFSPSLYVVLCLLLRSYYFTMSKKLFDNLLNTVMDGFFRLLSIGDF